MTVADLLDADLWTTAYRMHLAGVAARLCPRVAFEACDSPPCARWFSEAKPRPGALRAERPEAR